MDRVLKKLVSMKVTIFLLFAFGLFSGVATFVENDFGVETSWALIYTSWWFEAIQIALGILLIYNINHYKLYTRDKLPSFLFHISFVFILIGSGITRYYGFEGTLHIREGMQEITVISSDSFIQVSALKEGKSYGYDHKQLISLLGGNGFNFSFDVEGEKARVAFKKFIPNATKKVVDAPDGSPMISMMLSGYGESVSVSLKEGESYATTDYLFNFNNDKKVEGKKVVNFTLNNGQFFIQSNEPIHWFKMAENTRGELGAQQEKPFVTGQLYTIGEINFAPRYIGLKGKETILEDANPMLKAQGISALLVELSYKGETKEVALLGRGKGSKGKLSEISVGGVPFRLEWGTKMFTLPFFSTVNRPC